MTSAPRHGGALPLFLETPSLPVSHCPAAAPSIAIALLSCSTSPVSLAGGTASQLPACDGPHQYPYDPPLRAPAAASASASGLPLHRSPDSSCSSRSSAGQAHAMSRSRPIRVPCVTSAASGSQLPVAVTSSPLQKLREMRDGGVRARSTCSRDD